jgi:transcriptional regulatory protein RtcR
VGGDREVESDFQLIAGTNRDLRIEVAAGRFREDLLARINLWTYELPGMAARSEDIEPNLDYSLAQFCQANGQMVRFNKEARIRYLQFAESPDATWRGNFRDLIASVTRMATLADSGRITEAIVADEILRLRSQWTHGTDFAQGGQATPTLDILRSCLTDEAIAAIDLFDQVQLAAVIDECRRARTISEAGRTLFAASRVVRASTNDADRLRKYLTRFKLSFESITA